MGSVLICSAQDYRKIPDKIKSIYGGFFLEGKPGSVEQMTADYLKPMQQAGFNVCELKLHRVQDTVKPEIAAQLKQLVKAVNDHGMVFMAYLYPDTNSGNGNRDPKVHAALPAMVNEKGETIPTKFSMAHWEVWETIFASAFKLAEFSKELPIAAVKLDIETLSTQTSYDDQSWQKYAAEKNIPADTPAAERVKYLKDNNLFDDYQQWFIARIDNIILQLEKKLHAINPKLSLGMMPQHGSTVGTAMMKYFGTAEAPAIIDNWDMYNGLGFTPDIEKTIRSAKALNPHNRCVTWFRINSYQPEYIASHAYHAAKAGDGYSSWVLHMLMPQQDKLAKSYQLPGKHTPQEYYAAYAEANAALASGTDIPLKPIKPLVAQLENLDKVQIPNLRPVGNGSGNPQFLVLREQQIIYFLAETGKEIKFEIAHVAGNQRPMSLQYIIYGPGKKQLRNEAVSAGEKSVFTVTPADNGTGALVITGGEGGLAWYSVRVHSSHIGLLATPRAYFFFSGSRTMYGVTTPGELSVRCAKWQMMNIKFNGAAAQVTEDKPYITKMTDSGTPFVLSYEKIADAPKGYYLQDIFIMAKTAKPLLLSDGPERILVAE